MSHIRYLSLRLFAELIVQTPYAFSFWTFRFVLHQNTLHDGTGYDGLHGTKELLRCQVGDVRYRGEGCDVMLMFQGKTLLGCLNNKSRKKEDELQISKEMESYFGCKGGGGDWSRGVHENKLL